MIHKKNLFYSIIWYFCFSSEWRVRYEARSQWKTVN